MTAKEYCQFVEWDATEELISMLQDFATIKCKEQRELDAMLYRDIMYEALGNKKVTNGEMVERIRNNKQPEV